MAKECENVPGRWQNEDDEGKMSHISSSIFFCFSKYLKLALAQFRRVYLQILVDLLMLKGRLP
jgi:hypothetical protein